ncbi:MAG: phosphohistidine phosphatase SixA [Candidatus Tumulicola sp.]
MKCYFLRHGLAADPARWEGRDADRPLTREGKDRMAREAKSIAALSLKLDAIVSSPLLRAQQTAEIVAAQLGMPVQTDPRLGIGFDIRALGEILAERRSCDAVMLVGHEPGMSMTIGAASGGSRVVLKKGGLACLEFGDVEGCHGELLWLVPPKILAGS